VSVFIAACVLLVVLSGLFYLFPRRYSGGADEDLERANLEWYRLRQREIAAEGSEDLAADAQLRLLEDEQQQPAVTVEATREDRGRFPLWTLMLVVAVFSSVLYLQLGAVPDVLISRRLQALNEDSTAGQMQSLMAAIEQRATARPDNLHYVAMLGRFYMGQQDYARAAERYTELARKAPGDAQALAYAAQAQYLAAGRSLADGARIQAEQALAIDPHQRTALGLLGMASYEQGKYRAAVEYWQRLIAMEPPESETAQMIGGIIAMAREKLGESAPATAPEVAGPGVTVEVSLPEGATIGAGDTVFVLARNAASESRMPIAVRRLQGRQLPISLRLDDSNSMAGQKLSEAASVLVLVQVSPDGRPGEANATWTGRAGPLAPSADGESVSIVLQPAAG